MAIGAMVFYRVSKPIMEKYETNQMEFMTLLQDSGEKTHLEIAELVFRALKK